MKFARRARWLPFLFTPSVAPTTKYPDQYEDLVSLVQNYDGGGWGIPDPREMALSVVSGAAAATRDTVVLIAGPEEIIRLLAMSGNVGAGAVPTAANVAMFQPDANLTVGINGVVALSATAQIGLVNLPPVIPPTWQLVAHYAGGDGLTIVNWRICFLRLPLGSAPCL